MASRPAGHRTRRQWLTSHGWTEATGHHFQAGTTRASLFTRPAGDVAVLVFRGTLGPGDFLIDLQVPLRPWTGPGLVHQGFGTAFGKIWPEMLPAVAALRCPVFFTGHSLGGALATLAAARWLNFREGRRPAALYTFGSPRVGDAGLVSALDGLFHARVVNGADPVSELPPEIPNPVLPFFRHAGIRHQLRGGRLTVGAAEDADRPATSAGADALGAARAWLRELNCGRVTVPEALAAHAPVNYSAAIAPLVGSVPDL